MKTYCIIALFVLWSLAFARVALAEPARPAPTKAERSDAARLKREADVLMDQDKYADAVALYAKAFDLSGDPALLYNQGRALEALGEYPDALDKLEKFDRDAPPAMRSKVPGLHDLITDLRGRIATLVVTTNASGARLLVREKTAGTIQKELRIRLRAGPASIEVGAEGYVSFKKDVDLTAGSTVKVDAQLAPKKTDALVIVKSRPSAEITIDGKQLGPSPLEVRVSPGDHTLIASAPGHETEKVPLNLALGDRREVDIELREPPGPLSHWWFWTTAGVIVVGAVTALLLVNTERPATRSSFGSSSDPVPGP